MPVIQVQHVSSFSSEDANHPAGSLLSSDTYRKWKCASAGEKQAVVVLQVCTIWEFMSSNLEYFMCSSTFGMGGCTSLGG